jgi:hypothetical protein
MPLTTFGQTDNSIGSSQQTASVNVLVTDFKINPGQESRSFLSQRKVEKNFQAEQVKMESFRQPFLSVIPLLSK